jgi:hypothetical protein
MIYSQLLTINNRLAFNPQMPFLELGDMLRAKSLPLSRQPSTCGVDLLITSGKARKRCEQYNSFAQIAAKSLRPKFSKRARLKKRNFHRIQYNALVVKALRLRGADGRRWNKGDLFLRNPRVKGVPTLSPIDLDGRYTSRVPWPMLMARRPHYREGITG